MSSYKANRNDKNSNISEKERADKNNAKNIQAAADVAIQSGHPIAAAVGGAVKVADKLTGGKASEQLGKAATKAMNGTPGGKKLQDASNKLSESGASDAISKVASMKGGEPGGQTGTNPQSPGSQSTWRPYASCDPRAAGNTAAPDQTKAQCLQGSLFWCWKAPAAAPRRYRCPQSCHRP